MPVLPNLIGRTEPSSSTLAPIICVQALAQLSPNKSQKGRLTGTVSGQSLSQSAWAFKKSPAV